MTTPGGPPADDGAPLADVVEITRGAIHRRLGELAQPAGAPRSVDDELAELVFDSSADRSTRSAVRSFDSIGAATRHLTFEGPDLLLEVQVEGRGREMTCQVVPPQPSTLEVRFAGGSIDLGRDDFGTFFVPELPAGSVSLRCVPLSARGAAMATSWLSI